MISAPSVTELRFDKIYKHMLADLMELDSGRFRSLGEAQCKSFVREGLAFCDAHNLTFFEHIEYVHFMMYFVGIGFPRDPRYTAVRVRWLTKPMFPTQPAYRHGAQVVLPVWRAVCRRCSGSCQNRTCKIQ